MNDLHTLLLGVALGAIPTAELGALMLAWASKRLGVSPSEIARFGDPSSQTDDGQ